MLCACAINNQIEGVWHYQLDYNARGFVAGLHTLIAARARRVLRTSQSREGEGELLERQAWVSRGRDRGWLRPRRTNGSTKTSGGWRRRSFSWRTQRMDRFSSARATTSREPTSSPPCENTAQLIPLSPLIIGHAWIFPALFGLFSPISVVFTRYACTCTVLVPLGTVQKREKRSLKKATGGDREGMEYCMAVRRERADFCPCLYMGYNVWGTMYGNAHMLLQHTYTCISGHPTWARVLFGGVFRFVLELKAFLKHLLYSALNTS